MMPKKSFWPVHLLLFIVMLSKLPETLPLPSRTRLDFKQKLENFYKTLYFFHLCAPKIILRVLPEALRFWSLIFIVKNLISGTNALLQYISNSPLARLTKVDATVEMKVTTKFWGKSVPVVGISCGGNILWWEYPVVGISQLSLILLYWIRTVICSRLNSSSCGPTIFVFAFVFAFVFVFFCLFLCL